MSGGISGTGEFDPGLYKIYLKDLEKSGELTPFQIKQDTLATLGGDYLGKLYLAPGSVPFLDPDYNPILTLDKMTPELFAWLMIRNDLDKISTGLDELIFKATETDETIGLLKLLKTISDAIKNLEKQIEEAKELDAEKIRKILANLVRKADEAYEKFRNIQLLLDLSVEELWELESILKQGKELPEKYEFLKNTFGELLETEKGRQLLGNMFRLNIEMKVRGEALESRDDQGGKHSLDKNARVQSEIELSSVLIQDFNNAMEAMGLDPKLINSIITTITQMTFKNFMQGNKSIQKIVLDLLQGESSFHYTLFDPGYGPLSLGRHDSTDLEKQILGILVTMTFTIIYMELQEIAELDDDITEGEKALMKFALASIMLRVTGDEDFKGFFDEDSIEYLQSEEFFNNVIFSARFLHDPVGMKEEMTLTEEELDEIVQKILENKEDVIGELLKNLKMLKALYAALLAMIEGGIGGGNILEILKGLKAIMAGQKEEVPFQPPDQPV